MAKIKIIAVVGPTASGKSALAIKLAKKFNGEVISADSRQVYRGMDVGTGKVRRDRTLPNDECKMPNDKYFYSKGIRHHLLDITSPKKQFTVDEFKRLAQKAISDIASRAKMPIVCGGTGLYMDTLIYDLPIPRVPPNWKLRKRFGKISVNKLFELIQKLDPQRAKTIDRHNPRRLIRALEIVLTTKKPVQFLDMKLLYSHGRSGLATKYEVLEIGINPGKETLAKKIEKRLEQRLGLGMIAEVKKLRKAGISWHRLESFGLEYRHLAMYLQGKSSFQAMRKALLGDIIRYSKHQMTWFKRNKNIRYPSDAHAAQQLVVKFIGQKTDRKVRRD